MVHTIIIAAGGSGGHLLPAQQLAILLKKDAKILFAGASLSKNPFFKREGFAFKDIASAPLSNPFRFLYRTVIGFCQSVALILKYRPTVVIGFGSYHSFPMLAAAALLRKKIVLYEANSILGKVNRLFFPFSHLLALQFPLGKNHAKFRYVSYFPWIREEKKHMQQEARRFYGLNSAQPVCLVFGGSQGAAFFNQSAPGFLLDCQVIHFTGKEDTVETVRHLYQKNGIQAVVKSFETEMGKAYAAADFVLGRSGAGTIAELIAYQIPAVLVPFPHAAEDHQSVNARFFCEKVKGGFWVPQKDFANLPQAIASCKQQLGELRESLQAFNQKKEKKVALDELIRTGFLK
jgi:UDP-N-acetylglucosamine--N-acetylmuramyl-(pentapeptide) pyrophosphoryl-undecaprenol N-acetylglucosamine transferase